jgi:hypothetical protein
MASIHSYAHSAFLKRLAELKKSEAGVERRIAVKDIAPEQQGMIDAIREDPVFKKNFGYMPCEFKMVELGGLITYQKEVYLDLAQELQREAQQVSTEPQLIDFCLAIRQKSDVSIVKSGENTYSFSSENQGLRLLGAEPKKIEGFEAVRSVGGLPTDALSIVVGFGSSRMNLLRHSGRFFLNNGVHRSFALYSTGTRYAPFIVQKVDESNLDFPDNYYDKGREEALGEERHPLLKDFWDPKLFVDLDMKPLRKSLNISITSEEVYHPVG